MQEREGSRCSLLCILHRTLYSLNYSHKLATESGHGVSGVTQKTNKLLIKINKSNLMLEFDFLPSFTCVFRKVSLGCVIMLRYARRFSGLQPEDRAACRTPSREACGKNVGAYWPHSLNFGQPG